MTPQKTTPTPITLRTALRKLTPYLWLKDRRMRLSVLLALVFMLATTAAMTALPLILKAIVNYLSRTKEPTSIYYGSLLLISYGVLWTATQLLIQIRSLLLARPLERAVHLLNIHAFDHVLSLSARFHAEHKTGSILSAIERAQYGFIDIFWGLLLFLLPTAIELVLASSILWYFYGVTYAAVLIALLLSYLGISLVTMRATEHTHEQYHEKESNARSYIVDSLFNIETVKYFNNQRFEHNHYNKLLSEREHTAVSRDTQDTFVRIAQWTLVGTGITLLTLLSGKSVLAGRLTVGDFVLINGYLLQFAVPLDHVGYIIMQMRKGIASVKNLLEIFQVQPEIKDIPNALALQAQQATITFDNVSFSYTDTRQILQNISFSVPTGHTVALVGHTGSGKSTIARLLLRFYDVTSGSIKINNHDIRTITQESLRALIGVVPQDAALFNNTLYYNIAYGNPQATPQQVQQAVTLANLDSFVAQLPDGLHTTVGERGLKLSGGEKQRVAIARALLKDPVIYIFDEATSALDTQTEHAIQRKLQEIAQSTTTLIIAHRLSTIVHADTIIVLDHGHIHEQGTHKQLLAHNSIYAQLWRKQSEQERCENQILSPNS